MEAWRQKNKKRGDTTFLVLYAVVVFIMLALSARGLINLPRMGHAPASSSALSVPVSSEFLAEPASLTPRGFAHVCDEFGVCYDKEY